MTTVISTATCLEKEYRVTPSVHPLGHAIITKFHLSSHRHVINLAQFTITAINLDLPLDFYKGSRRKYFENTFSSGFQQLMLILLNYS